MLVHFTLALPFHCPREPVESMKANIFLFDFCVALESGDLPAAGELLREGHGSLRDDYEVSVPELDVLCELADAQPGVYGSRLTGAGFGGCALHLVDPKRAEDAADHPASWPGSRFPTRSVVRGPPPQPPRAIG